MIDKIQIIPNSTTYSPKGIDQYKKEENTVAAAAEVSAAGVVCMKDATYANPGKTEEANTIDEIEKNSGMSAESHKNEMAVIASTTSAEDLQEMGKEGFSLTESDSHTVVTVIDKIKAQLAKAGVDISKYGDDLSAEQIAEITNSTALANQIMDALKNADLPVNSEIVEGIVEVSNQVNQMEDMSEEAMAYLIGNQKLPTVANVYSAMHSGSWRTNEESISEEEYSQIKEQVEKLAEEVDLKGDSREIATWLMQRELPVTAENMSYYEDLNQLEIGTDGIIEAAVNAIAEGGVASSAMMIEGYSITDQAKETYEIYQNATEDDVAYLISEEKEVTAENLAKVHGKVKGDEASLIKARRQLEEIRLLMTVDANKSLLKKGIQIDTRPIEKLVEDLKAKENAYYEQILSAEGLEATPQQTAVFSDTVRAMEELKVAPAAVLRENSNQLSLDELHTQGVALKEKYDAASERYETLMTSPRKDMGDSIQKAFQNVDDILKDLNLPTTEANQRAVRILGYNEIEITNEAIDKIKAADATMQRAFDNLTPRVTLEMIREGINPLDLSMEELTQKAEEISFEQTGKEEERFEKFLWKMEKNHEISEEERKGYIGIYRLIAQVEKADHAAVGSLLEQGSQITMRNLLTAVRSKNKGSMDYKIDDDFDGVNSTVKGEKIDAQIEASYQHNCAAAVADHLTPEALSNLPENWMDQSPEMLKEWVESQPVDESLEVEYAKEQLAEVAQVLDSAESLYAQLERMDVPCSVSNILALEQMLQNPGRMFETLLKKTKTDLVEDLKNEVLERFGEAIKTPEECMEAQEALAEVATHVISGMIIDGEGPSALDIRELRQMNHQFELASKMAKEESYIIPVEDGNGVTGISVKIVRGKAQKGWIDIMFRGELMGKVAASFEAKEDKISGTILVSDDMTKNILSEQIGRIASLIQEENPEPVDLRIAQIPDLSLEQIAKSKLEQERETGAEKTTVQTKRLYKIAESFITTVADLMA